MNRLNAILATKLSFSDGSRVEPVLEKSGGAHEALLKEYLGKTDSALEPYYLSLVIIGKASMPKTPGADAEVVAYVARVKGSVGYAGSDAAIRKCEYAGSDVDFGGIYRFDVGAEVHTSSPTTKQPRESLNAGRAPRPSACELSPVAPALRITVARFHTSNLGAAV